MDVDKQIRKIQNENVGSLNAESFIKNLHKKRNQNIMRVSYDEFTSKEEALVSLAKIRKENPKAWILTL